MLILLGVLPVIGGESKISGRFNNWLIRHIQINPGIYQVSAPELRACDSKLTVCAVSDEDRLLCRPDVELGVRALVDGDLNKNR